MFKQNTDYLNMNLKWLKNDNVEYPFRTEIGGHHLKIKLNDFPAEIMFSLLVDDNVICNFNDWPPNWER